MPAKFLRFALLEEAFDFMTYAEKLKDPRWKAFRDEFADWFERTKRRKCLYCESCGEEIERFHVHHKRYEDGLEPWEYSFDDLKMLCGECHEELHLIEKMVRAWIIAASSETIYEFASFMKILMEFKKEHQAHAACVARQELYDFRERVEAQDRRENGIRTPII